MSYNYKKVRDRVRILVKKACFSPKNKFTYTVWQYHILSVVEHSLKLGKKFKANLEVLELSALLHDYSNLVDYKSSKKHHIQSAKMAEEILIRLDYPTEKIKAVKECILSHRGSTKIKRKTIEAKILASTDAMSHFSCLADMFYLTYGIHKFYTKEGAIWLKNKLQRSWKKIMPEGKIIIQHNREIALEILNEVIK